MRKKNYLRKFKQSMLVLKPNSLEILFDTLKQKGYTLIGPRVNGGAIIYDEISSKNDLPIGWEDEQKPGEYRLKQQNNGEYFGYVLGPYSPKNFLYPPLLKILQVQRSNGGFEFISNKKKSKTPISSFYSDRDSVYGAKFQKQKLAFIGIRACELQAILIHDRIFLQDKYKDPYYKTMREQAFIIAVNCVKPGGTCFCASMKSGPKATQGFDLALTEILDNKQHYFLVEIGSERGKKILDNVPKNSPKQTEIEEANKALNGAFKSMGRTIDTSNIKEHLYNNFEHPRWDNVAKRCLSCANCTMVCPTCFCSTVEDVTTLTGKEAERWRRWDSCFSIDFSYIHGGSVRSSVKSRYRQWLTHKFANWIDQFGTSGCVGCGRCITWCPVGIDITEEVYEIRKTTQITQTDLGEK